jgi:aminopeptidase N
VRRILTRSLRVALASAAFLCTAAATSPSRPFSLDATYGLLPKNVVPLDYDIALRPNIAHATFAGNERVRIRVRSATATIVVDTNMLHVSSARLSDGSVPRITTAAAAMKTTLRFSRVIRPGSYALDFAFAGKIRDDDAGLFSVTYPTAHGSDTLLMTQLESIDARSVFPCWDEPVFRATFRLTATVPSDFTTVSNMPIESERKSGALKTVTFERTPSMASYLLVFAAGRFGSIAGRAGDVPIRVYAPLGREQRGRYALAAAEELLPYYESYFGVRYPLPKLDLIDVPGSFPGAMENWGGITSEETGLLLDSATATQAQKQNVFTYVAHEMAHQWAGDLVSIDWWSDIWLAEGFADWMETKATDRFNPQWHMWDRVESDVAAAMRVDALGTAHPIRKPIVNDADADSDFDQITYQKSGALVRMLEEYLGEATFRAGVQQYMRAHAYSNATSADLWAALGAASHRDVAALADAWTTDPGFPLVTADATCASGARTLALSQQRFFAEPGEHALQRWQIPVAIASGGAPEYTLLTGATASANAGACGAPLVVNAGAVGYYRVRYDAASFAALLARFDALAVPERARLADDTGALVFAGRLDIASEFGLLGAFGADEPLAVWNAAFGSLDRLAVLEEGRPGEAAFDAYRVALLRPAFAKLGWDGGDETAPELREQLIERLGAAGDADLIAACRDRFEAYLAQPSSLAPALVAPVLSVVGTNADLATWLELRALTVAAHGNVARAADAAVVCAHDPTLAERNLGGALEKGVSPERALAIVQAVATQGRQRALAWTFFEVHGRTLLAALGPDELPFRLASFIRLFGTTAPPGRLAALAAAFSPSDEARRALHAAGVAAEEQSRLAGPLDRLLAVRAAESPAPPKASP